MPIGRRGQGRGEGHDVYAKGPVSAWKLPLTKAHTATLIYHLGPYFPGDLDGIFCRPASLERETGIEPATNGLGSRDSTTELLPLVIDILSHPATNPAETTGPGVIIATATASTN